MILSLEMTLKFLPFLLLIFAAVVFAAPPEVAKPTSGAACNALPREWSAGSVTMSEVLDRASSPDLFDAYPDIAVIDKERPSRIEYAIFGLG